MHIIFNETKLVTAVLSLVYIRKYPLDGDKVPFMMQMCVCVLAELYCSVHIWTRLVP